MRVLYYTVVPVFDGGSGGSLACRNHVCRLAADPAVELFAMVAGYPEWKEATDAFFASLGVRSYFQPFLGDNVRHEANRLSAILAFATKAVFQYPWEMRAINQAHVQAGIDWAIKGYSIDILIIDYHPSALFLRLPRDDVRTVLIGHNREADFYEGQQRLGLTHHGSLTGAISLRRLRRFETRTNAAVDLLVTIGEPDLPATPTRAQPICITPYLDPNSSPWSYTGSQSAFFVGSIGHYPNRLAIEWITRRLAPALLERRSRIRLVIVGAMPDDVLEQDRRANVELLGRASVETVARLFRTSDAMLCPVRNDFGVKFKSLEALSYGTPLLASRSTLLGLPHLRDMPALDLDRPDHAADLVCSLLSDPARLRALAASQLEQQARFIATQGGVWSRTLDAIPAGRAA